jgi:hypothetical protein
MKRSIHNNFVFNLVHVNEQNFRRSFKVVSDILGSYVRAKARNKRGNNFSLLINYIFSIHSYLKILYQLQSYIASFERRDRCAVK